MLLVLCSEAEFVAGASSVMISEAFEVLLKEAEIIFKLEKGSKNQITPNS
jgi:hypothetical protein